MIAVSNWRGKHMEHIPTAISVVALTVSFFAVTICRKKPSEVPKDKKTRRKRQPKEAPAQA
jgi:hypothetical protein